MNDKQCNRLRRVWKTSPKLQGVYPNIRAYRREVQRHDTLFLVPVGQPLARPYLAIRSALRDIDRNRHD